ncbi:hypothetical protein H0H92_002550 [Tricholoma furcatifolium]|nr:hypothetical protein H0H92_002550 [Tricholoma furcatifolium]
MSYSNGSVSPYPPTSDPGVLEAPEALESDVEDEVDQLDSESDTAETETDTQTGGAIGQCPQGETLLPQERLESILSADETIPIPIPISEALTLRASKELKESFDDNPTAPPSGHPSTSVSVSAPKKSKSRTNGTAPKKSNDTEYNPWTATRPPRPAAKPTISISNGRVSLSARPSPLANGHSASTASTRSGTQTPAQSHAPNNQPSPQIQPSSTITLIPAQAEEGQSAPPQPPLGGPTSGFVQSQEGTGPFARDTQNPGRTIYSQEFRGESQSSLP